MRHIKNFLAGLALVAIFAGSFAAGRFTANREAEILSDTAEAALKRENAALPMLRASEKAAASSEELAASAAAEKIDFSALEEEAEDTEEAEEEPPSRMPLPVVGSMSKGYSLQNEYSETMGDWRAHEGIDIEAELTAAVSATADGVVAAAYTDKLWGNVIEIEHSGGLKTIYKGVSTLEMVSVGDEVFAGDIISGVGEIPAESKSMPHLHFETVLDGVCVNPECYVTME